MSVVIEMSSLNILAEDLRISTNLKQKHKQKRKSSTKISKKSVLRSENKIPRHETIMPNLNTANFIKFETFELERTSTPNHINLCEHCKHSHAQVWN